MSDQTARNSPLLCASCNARRLAETAAGLPDHFSRTFLSRVLFTTRLPQIDGVYIEIGLASSSVDALDLLETNPREEIHLDGGLEAGVRGVFAAGDANDVRGMRVIIAATEGAKATLAAFNYLFLQT